MKDLVENNLIRFTNLTRKKNALFANFRVKGLKNGVTFSASISVDLTAIDLTSGDPLDKIVEECARHGLREFNKADFKFEGASAVAIDQYLGVAQLG